MARSAQPAEWRARILKIVGHGRHGDNFGRLHPELVHSWNTLVKFGADPINDAPNSAGFGSISREFAPTVVEIGRMSAETDRNLAESGPAPNWARLRRCGQRFATMKGEGARGPSPAVEQTHDASTTVC